MRGNRLEGATTPKLFRLAARGEHISTPRDHPGHGTAHDQGPRGAAVAGRTADDVQTLAMNPGRLDALLQNLTGAGGTCLKRL